MKWPFHKKTAAKYWLKVFFYYVAFEAGIQLLYYFTLNMPQQQPAYHALSPEEHQKLVDEYLAKDFVPVNVSVTSVNGKRYYSAFYEREKWVVVY